VTAEMRRRLVADLTTIWHDALEARWRMHAGSPVAVLDRLLQGAQPTLETESPMKIVSRISPEEINEANQGRSLIRSDRP
jgi:hypothetical protein